MVGSLSRHDCVRTGIGWRDRSGDLFEPSPPISWRTPDQTGRFGRVLKHFCSIYYERSSHVLVHHQHLDHLVRDRHQFCLAEQSLLTGVFVRRFLIAISGVLMFDLQFSMWNRILCWTVLTEFSLHLEAIIVATVTTTAFVFGVCSGFLVDLKSSDISWISSSTLLVTFRISHARYMHCGIHRQKNVELIT